jgi:hypothetical protein
MTHPDVLYDLVRARHHELVVQSERIRLQSAPPSVQQLSTHLAVRMLAHLATRLDQSRRAVPGSHAYKLLTTGTFASR